MTLVEVLIVVTLLGIAAAIGVPMLMQPGSMKIQAAARMIMGDIAIAQNEAVGQVEPRRIHFDVPNNSYRLTDGEDNTIGVPWDMNGYEVSFKNDSRFSTCQLDSADFAGQPWVGFDETGSPINGGTVELSAQGFKYRITVRAFTGRVDVEPVE